MGEKDLMADDRILLVGPAVLVFVKEKHRQEPHPNRGHDLPRSAKRVSESRGHKAFTDEFGTPVHAILLGGGWLRGG